MRITIITCFVLVLIASTMAQTSYKDSLEQVIATTTNEAEKKESLFLLSKHLVQRNPEQAEVYANQLSEMPNTPKDSTEWGRLNYIYGSLNRWQGNYTTALEYYKKNYNHLQLT